VPGARQVFHFVVGGVRRRSLAGWLGVRRRVAVLAGAVATARGRSRISPAWRPAGTGGALVVVAHPDDDLFFLSPDIVHDVQAGRPVATVYTTSGDAGRPDRYWRGRERGVAAAYARMAGVADRWSMSRVAVGPAAVTEAVLCERPTVRLYFLRLPDGGMNGEGTARSGAASLQRLEEGAVARLWTVETPARPYSRPALVDVLGRIVAELQPVVVRTLDDVGPYGDGDHSDHHAVARLVAAARDRSAPGVSVVGYVGYPTRHLPANVAGADLQDKADALAAYARFDPLMCQRPEEYRTRPEGPWLSRQHRVSGRCPTT
jgi:LmbE family N-acetylglucosaminyl deacetylase